MVELNSSIKPGGLVTSQDPKRHQRHGQVQLEGLPATAAGPSHAERERRLLEGAGFDPDKRATPEEIKAREEKRRAEHRETTQTRGDESLER